jgi:hypothetical protein
MFLQKRMVWFLGLTVLLVLGLALLLGKTDVEVLCVRMESKYCALLISTWARELDKKDSALSTSFGKRNAYRPAADNKKNFRKKLREPIPPYR